MILLTRARLSREVGDVQHWRSDSLELVVPKALAIPIHRNAYTGECIIAIDSEALSCASCNAARVEQGYKATPKTIEKSAFDKLSLLRDLQVWFLQLQNSHREFAEKVSAVADQFTDLIEWNPPKEPAQAQGAPQALEKALIDLRRDCSQSATDGARGKKQPSAKSIYRGIADKLSKVLREFYPEVGEDDDGV